jgi:AcrR family transcriptional regulator
MVQAIDRRARVRAATASEILDTARRLLVEQGPEAVTLRAIAREMGLTAPALYRYYDSRETLIKYVVANIFIELTDDMHAAITRAKAAGGDVSAQVIAAAWEFRRWSLGHRKEFGLVFGSPLPGVCVEKDDITAEGGARFGNTFFVLILDLWNKHPFPVPADDEIDPGLLAQLRRYRDTLGALGTGLPLGLLLTFLRCWIRLYGIVSLEVFGHLGFALDDAAPMFEIALAETAPLLGVEYPGRP